mmetsp:Transcript_32782/g.54904  ORF Transcript_32782/g.54904 Transcript_32782/m.54904 type:complete len:237 (-) Transcript_32782:6-716(-)|eukprot:CAMPEP_0198231976 /NCGR_PEP_ID=MMETSP1445-20131203/115484_1 /TAXON_ID=36898 /ORGANISM="Pyramimonas sp., Strain CCMP2087" /LENGTH=236 /DNA_ID=CAMNT_0043912619 /DNA_START=103 /DNA_END=813 /DNA_ORIENTATION=-
MPNTTTGRETYLHDPLSTSSSPSTREGIPSHEYERTSPSDARVRNVQLMTRRTSSTSTSRHGGDYVVVDSRGADGSGAMGAGPVPLSQEAIGRWGAALGNMQDLGLVVDHLARTLNSAVYLDEDAHNAQAQVQKFKNALKASTNRIAVLEAEAELTQRELATALAKNQQMERALKESLATSASLSQEQANTAVVFKMHYSELLARTEEINLKDAEMERLKGVIEVIKGDSPSRSRV